MKNIDKLSIKTIRVLTQEMITKASSGHPGIALGAAPIMYTLYSKVLKVNPKNPKWFNRDRFILASGHASSLLYTQLYLSGYDLTIDDLKDFRQLNSKTPGHPELDVTPGVDCSSGPLGQGIPFGVGLSLSESYLRNLYNTNDHSLIDYYTYVLCGDGDLQEGVTCEALSLCGRLKLNKLIILYDSNDIQLDGEVKGCNTEDVKKKVEAMGFKHFLVKDGENIDEIYSKIKLAKKSDKPSLIEVKTIIGKTSKNENNCSVHGNPLKIDEVVEMRKALGGEEFTVCEDVIKHFKTIQKKLIKNYNLEQIKLNEYRLNNQEKYQKFNDYLNKKVILTKESLGLAFDATYNKATRNCCTEIINRISEISDIYIGGSADLTKSTCVKGVNGDYDFDNLSGRNIRFGVREHAMASISNGISLNGITRSFCSGFFVFSDYLKPAIRLASMMGLPTNFIFSHDSIAVGEDGPTHEPIEQLTMLRSIPNLNVIRPQGRTETIEAFIIAYNSYNNPTAIITSRQGMKEYRTNENYNDFLTLKGAYIIKEEANDSKLDCVLLATGSEVSLAIDASIKLKESNINARVVSMPSMYLFDQQPKEYKDYLLPDNTLIVGVEMSDATHMYKYIKNGKLLNIQTFGASGKSNEVIEHFGFTTSNLVGIVKESLK